MNQSILSRSLVAVTLALTVATLTGCPDTSLNPGGADGGGGAAPIGRLKLVQTLVMADDAQISGVQALVVSPDGEVVYVNSWISGDLGTFGRSGVDGSLTRKYSGALFAGIRLALTPDGKHLYAAGNNSSVLQQFDLDPVTGEPTFHPPGVMSDGYEMTLAAGGSVLYVAAPDIISSYLIDKESGALTPGAETSVDSMLSYTLLADDAQGALFANRDPAPAIFIVRYTVDAATGALTKEAEIGAAAEVPVAVDAMCSGTTRVYVPQAAGSIGYFDTTGKGISLSSTFTHPDLVNATSVSVSPDCKNVYVVTLDQDALSGAVVVLARDAAGDLTWLETLPTGPGTPLSAITQPLVAQPSPDGKNVYLASSAPGEGIAVFQRDLTGAGLR